MHKKPVLSIFADGVRFDSLQFMPFLQSLHSVKLESVLGYSISCHPSMYTGVYPNKHKIGFHWVKSNKKHGPYSLLSYFPNIFPFSNPFVQAVLSHFYAKFFLKKKANPFMGYGKILNTPMKFWNQIEINEFKYWDDDNYISSEIKTIFELVRKNKVKYHISGLHKPNLGVLDTIKEVDPSKYDWVYYFIGESDSISHEFNQHSLEGINFLQNLDKFIKKQYGLYVETYGEKGFDFIFWSDHGHITIDKRFDLYEEFKKSNHDLNKIFHIIDSTTARFWPVNDTEHEQIIKIMEQIPEVHLVTESQFKELHLPNDNNIYGKLFYYLDGGSVFINTIHGFGLKTKSMHGYHPKADGNEGVFVSNRYINTSQVVLPDVFVSTISSLGIDYKPNIELDGKNVLS